MHIRRCSILLIEPREQVEFDFDSLLAGGNGLRAERSWVALAPHLGSECILCPEEVVLLGAVSSHEWVDSASLADPGQALVAGLVAKGLLISDAPDAKAARARDDELRAMHWHGRAAVTHAFGRWQGVAAGEEVRNIGIQSVVEMVERLGTPPTHFHSRSAGDARVVLPAPELTGVDTMLRRRVTCRNFDPTRHVPLWVFSQLMHRTFGAQAVHAVSAETAIVKRTSPSAGGLHPTEAYLLIQRVETVAPGLYHYHVGEHALEPLQALSSEEAVALAGRFVAQQDWLASAHALVVLAPRFTRSFWKYRDHAKVYRAVTLDVGHLSQTLLISATEFGLGGFVTAAINEVDIEQALGLQTMQESPLAVCGFGWRAAERSRMEFDPQHAVWPD